ncbi:phospholipid-transporting ATPase IB [Oncorhynchus nerka]|uniref:phospholipid-transporting ATPase IB n=1 Tax=Oncorhynchus nerka TaxID=8023 RepID=UPI00112FE4B9|nr:phospholipid-transporting ATPase IB-like [Oncorhynchus nerka]XP_029486657.1 phospholipid-transporting ATPase IB-like [Oncorhynchus nerka]
MSVLVREPEGGLNLCCKGADIVILERLQKDCPYLESTVKALDSLYENWFIILYNVFYTDMPVEYLGFFEQEMRAV